MLLMHNNNR